MTDERARLSLGNRSRRRFLGGAVAATTAAIAGCSGSILDSSPTRYEIEPEEPSEPRKGSPGEFYYFLEENGIDVDTLVRDDEGDDPELVLLYRSTARTVEESNEEILIVYEVYKQALIERGSAVSFLYCEITNPFDGQARGWGVDTEWIRTYDSDDADESARDSDPAGDDGTELDGDGAETDGDGVDVDHLTLWNNIMNSKIYDDTAGDGSDD